MGLDKATNDKTFDRSGQSIKSFRFWDDSENVDVTVFVACKN